LQNIFVFAEIISLVLKNSIRPGGGNRFGEFRHITLIVSLLDTSNAYAIGPTRAVSLIIVGE
jgi:hypothetical protein